MCPSFRALHSISAAFRVLSSIRMPGLRSQELRLRVLLRDVEMTGRIFQPEQTPASPTECMGHSLLTLAGLGFRPGSK